MTLRDGADLLQHRFGRSHRTGALAYTLERLAVAAASGRLSDVTLATLQLRTFLSHQGLTPAADTCTPGGTGCQEQMKSAAKLERRACGSC